MSGTGPIPDALWRAIFDAAPDPIVVVDSRGVIRLVNRAVQTQLRHAPDVLIGSTIETLVPAGRRDDHARHRRGYLRSPRVRPMGSGLRLEALRGDGTTVPVDITLAPVAVPEGTWIIAVVRDVTQWQRSHDRLMHESRHDELTGLLNRRGFLEAAEHVMAQLRRRPSPAAFVLFDLDGFKAVNDRLGHAGGDELLRVTARVLRDRFRGSDLLARYGGDEFAALMMNTDAQTAADVVRGVLGGSLAASAGLCDADPEQSAAALIERADAALYEAKAASDGSVCVAGTATSTSAVPPETGP